MKKFVNNSLFGKNKGIKIAKRLSAILLLTFKFASYALFPWKLNRYPYGVQFGITCTALDQSNLSNFVELTIKDKYHMCFRKLLKLPKLCSNKGDFSNF